MHYIYLYWFFVFLFVIVCVWRMTCPKVVEAVPNTLIRPPARPPLRRSELPPTNQFVQSIMVDLWGSSPRSKSNSSRICSICSTTRLIALCSNIMLSFPALTNPCVLVTLNCAPHSHIARHTFPENVSLVCLMKDQRIKGGRITVCGRTCTVTSSNSVTKNVPLPIS
eukprot:sb/3472387/